MAIMDNQECDRICAQLGELADDLWMSRRLQVSELIRSLEQAASKNDAQIQDYIKFIEFLADQCSGKEFTCDKQWNELLNSMQISRKLNHRTVRVRDILRKKSHIEANVQRITRINQAARLAKSIERSLGELSEALERMELQLSADEQGEESASWLADLSSVHDQLSNKLKRSMRIIRIELDNELLSSDSRKDVWFARLSTCESSARPLTEFIDSLRRFQVSMNQLRPLMDSAGPAELVQECQSEIQVSRSLVRCRERFNSSLSFRNQLMAWLRDLARDRYRKRGQPGKLLLSKLTSIRGMVASSQRDLSADGKAFAKKLLDHIGELDECRRQLDDLMQNLRLEFGRFYFLNDTELLQVIALDEKLITTASSSREAEQLILKLYNNSIASFQLDDSNERIVGVRSPSGELIELRKQDESVPIKKRVNLYSVQVVRILSEVGRKLRKALRRMLAESLMRQSDEVDWSLPVQLMLLAEQIKFCSRVESELKLNGRPDASADFYRGRLLDLNSKSMKKERWIGEDISLGQLKRSAIISQSVELISLLEELQRQQVFESPEGWSWHKQMRYYATGEGDNFEVKVSSANANFTYQFHYLALETNESHDGSQIELRRLIRTDITTRCFLLAAQATANFRLGANPFGPAGGGKTESIKALGRLLGRQVIVHNCDPSNDEQSLGRLIWGLAHTGLWGCLDEFNRLQASVLSTVSEALELVQKSIRLGDTTVRLPDGRMVCVDREGAFFITLNPAGTETSGGYRGRRRLPANLRQLFLPVAMVRNELANVACERLLILSSQLDADRDTLKPSEALDVASKLAKLFNRLAGYQSDRCQWDLRLLMATLARLKILIKSRNEEVGRPLSLPELLIMSLWLESSPRLMQTVDCQHLRAAISESFLGIDVARICPEDYSSRKMDITDRVKDILTRKQLEPQLEEYLTNRALMLQDQLETRTGVLLLGPSGSGKSSAWRLLAEAKRQSVAWIALNPRALSPGQPLFGFSHPLSRKWIDGQMTSCVRRAHKMLQGEANLSQIWLVLDGPVDPDWIESLNSALDDNRTLTLSSGERLDFCLGVNRAIKLLVETDDVQLASPATISRLGLVSFVKSTESVEKETEGPKMLTVISGGSHTSRQVKISSLFEGERATVYNCSEATTASHLVSAIKETQTTLVIHNIRLIAAEDQWQVRSFIELLRFVLTYGGVYEQDESQTDLRPLGVSFFLSVDSIEPLGGRLQRLAKIIQLEEDSDDARQSVADVTLDGALESIRREGRIHSFSITSQSASMRIIEVLEADGTVCKFYDSHSAFQWVERLEKILTDESDETSREILFVLEDIELLHNNRELCSKIYHLTNTIIWRADKRVKLVNFGHKLVGNIDQLAFWGSAGSLCRLAEEETNVQQMVEGILGVNSVPFSRDHLIWIAERVSVLVSKQVGDPPDELDTTILKEYLRMVDRLVSKAHKQQFATKTKLRKALARLAEFEQSLDGVKSKREAMDMELRRQQSQVEALMSSSDLALKQANDQQQQLDVLRDRQLSKQKELVEKRTKLDKELEDLTPLIESSKRQVEMQLRPEALNELRTLRAPPSTVRDVLEVLFILLGQTDRSWPAIKSQLAARSLRDELTSFDFRARLSSSLLKKAKAEMAKQADSFTDKQVQRASSALVPVVGWIRAALAYGGALERSRPLEQETKALISETSELEAQTHRLTERQLELKELAASESRKLLSLRTKCSETQEKSQRIRRQIETAERTREQLVSQVKGWTAKLEDVEDKLGRSGETLTLAAAVAALAIFGARMGQSEVLEVFQLPEEQFPLKAVEMFWPEGVEVGEKVAQTIDRQLQTLLVRLNLSDGGAVTLIAHEQGLQMDEQLLGALAGLSASGQVELIRCSRTNDWQQSLELAIRLDKLALLAMSSADCAVELDLVTAARRRPTGAGVVLLGEISSHSPPLLRQCRVVRVQSVDSSTNGQPSDHEQVLKQILAHLVRFYDRLLADSAEELGQQLGEKKRELEQAEFKLLDRLADPAGQRKQMSLDESDLQRLELVVILNELQQLRESLAADIDRLEAKAKEISTRQSKYMEAAREATNFYVDHLAELAATDPFSSLNLSRFIGLILDRARPSSAADARQQVDLARVARRTLFALTPTGRQRMKGKLRKWLSSSDRHCLGQAVADLLQHDLVEPQEAKLMLVTHGVARSSPQAIIDELLAGKSAKIEYRKVYAGGKLEQNMEKIVSDWQSDKANTRICCLCVANSHLSIDWFNNRFMELLQRVQSSNLKLLVILVAELNESEQFERKLVDYAHLKFRYEELSVGISERFERMLSRSSSIISSTAGEHKSLVRQLAGLHLVCQELTKAKDNTVGWKSSTTYNFDDSQFDFALRVLERLTRELTGDRLTVMLGHYLRDIVYCTRMETCEDEELLDRLVKRFITSDAKGKLETHTFLEGIVSAREQSIDDDEGSLGPIQRRSLTEFIRAAKDASPH